MNKKLFILPLIFIFCIVFAHFTYATNVVMDLNNSAESTNNAIVNDTNTLNTTQENNQIEDNTVYSSNPSTTSDATVDDQMPTTSAISTDEYEDSGELSITNMINIILIVVGVVLILLGIAIIIRLK